MTDNLVNFFIELFNGINKDIIIFIISMMPILELRGGLLAASILNISLIKGLIICILGNMLPIPFVLLLIEYIFNLLEKFKLTKKIVKFIKNKALKKSDDIKKYGYLGLILFVGIPLPGTGAWTGALLAVLLNLDKKKSFVCIFLGVILASIIMTIISYGFIGNLIR